MALSEFELIDRFFNREVFQRGQGVILGIGDDCALLNLRHGEQLAVSMDTMVSGVHFPVDADAEDIGYRLLASNLSDLAAMGAEPVWFTLAMTLPEVKEHWLEGFVSGLSILAQEHHLALVGGDTTKGPLTLTVQVHGRIPLGQALRRDGALAGDKIYVSGTLGDAAAGLPLALSPPELTTDYQRYLLSRFYRPSPRVEHGRLLRPYASAAVDISDGLLADLGHICKRSHMGAELDLDLLPMSEALLASGDRAYVESLALSGGEDFELCFTVNPADEEQMLRELERLHVPLTCIGTITHRTGIRLLRNNAEVEGPERLGFRHF
ncbi:thiamine-phosphate kinase [Pokkaliibacter sp. CJK22405]|uniref:thiamine-phosphate kinase n=1 Tax=Pokkaliibacter sp. CJK22405 TaxID=3384615 RepID=UPI0039851F02